MVSECARLSRYGSPPGTGIFVPRGGILGGKVESPRRVGPRLTRSRKYAYVRYGKAHGNALDRTEGAVAFNLAVGMAR